MTLLNRAAQFVSTTGTGSTLALGNAVDLPLPLRGFDTLANAGATNGITVSYYIQDGAAWEYGRAVYSTSGPSLTGRTVVRSSEGTSEIDLSGNAQVFITPLIDDVVQFNGAAAVFPEQGSDPTTPDAGAVLAYAKDDGLFYYKTSDGTVCGLGRRRLTGNATYYVNGALGSDSNDGLSSGAGAFATIMKAINTVAALDLSIYNVTIYVADATFNESLVLPPLVGSGRVTLIGNSSTPANCVLNSANCVTSNAPYGAWEIDGFKLVASGYGISLAQSGTGIAFRNLDFGACGYHMGARAPGTYIQANTDYTISGGAGDHFRAEFGGAINTFGRTVTLIGTPNFTNQFARASFSFLVAASMTFVGPATGKRFSIYLNGVANVGGGGASYFPGDAPGTEATGGQYN